jgi:hypothetical protein
MSAPGCCVQVSADELVSIALHHVNATMLYILDDLDGQITPDQRHHIRDLLTAAEGPLLTPPVRPADWSGF